MDCSQPASSVRGPGPRVYGTRVAGAPAGGGHQVRARTTALTPRTPEEPRTPRADQAGSAQPGIPRSPGPRPRVAKKSAAELGRRALARLARSQRTLKGKKLQHPALHYRTPGVQGEREEGLGPADARVWPQTYPVLRAPLLPLEDAPLPQPPLPGRAGSGREELRGSMLSPLYDPTLTSIHNYWKNHSFDRTDLCRQSDISAF